MITFGSIFAGVGGFDEGFKAAGMKCLWRIEKDTHCQNVLRYHDRETPIYGAIEDVKPTELVRPNLICFGFPCQDLSVAGKREGLAGRRSGLFFQSARIVSVLKPEWFVIENVPGLLSSNEKRDFATVLRWMGQFGYLQAWRIFDSQYFGVAQRRRRVFIVGSLGNGRAAEVLFESESLRRNPAEGCETGKEVAGTFKSRSRSGGFHTDPECAAGGYMPPVEHFAATGRSKYNETGGG